jgi:phosphatidylglycerol:prolipoprotein diacylglycerol transferase
MYPVLFRIPFIDAPVYAYGVMLGLSCVLGAHLAVYLCSRSGIKRNSAWWFALIVIVIGVASGRLHELLVQGKLFSSQAFEVSHSGRTAYGGFIGGTVAAIVAARYLKVPFWRFADAAAPTLALGLGLTRIGCFLYGCDYGFRSENYGVVFPGGSPASRDHVEAGLLSMLPSGAYPDSLSVFPAQLLASFLGFLLFGFTLWIWFRRPRRAGTVFLTFGLLYGIGRAGLEALREDSGRGTLFGMTTSTTIGLVTAALTIGALAIPQLARLREDAGPVLDPPPEDEDEKAGKNAK